MSISTSKPKVCKHCGDEITRSAPLSPRTCIGCYRARHPKEKVTRTVPAYTMTRASTTEGSARPLKAKQQPHRDRSLLDLAHMVHECQNCGAHSAHGCEPAHANGAEWGKGMSMKAGDGFHAALCHGCHAWLDSLSAFGADPSDRFSPFRDDRRSMWTAAHFKTMALYWRNGWIKVAA
jgi:hypothetical protein